MSTTACATRRLTFELDRRHRSQVARVTVYATADRTYAIERHRYDLGGMPEAWFALAWKDGWNLLGRHRTRAAAERHCRHHARDLQKGMGVRD